jgi:hypothetical protein
LLPGVGPDVLLDRLAARLLFALDQELDVHRELAAHGEHRLDRLDVGVGLPLVVGRAAADQAVALFGRLERRVAPFVERVGRLHVVVAVEQHRGLVRAGPHPLGIDQRVPGGGDLLGGESGRLHLGHQPVGAAVHILPVGRVGRDRRDPEVLLELGEIATLLAVDQGENVVGVGGHDSL